VCAQTKVFIDGYITGYCKIQGNATSFESDQAEFSCIAGPSSADWRIPYNIRVTHSQYMTGYKQGFAEGVKDGHASWFHHAKLRTWQPGFSDGYAAVAVLVLLTILPIQVNNAMGQAMLEVTKTNGHKPISGGIVIMASGVSPGGINLLYKYIDHTSGTSGTDQVNATENGEMHLLGFSSDEDNGYYPGDKVTVSVSKYVPNGDMPYATIDANGHASYIPQPVIDNKTVTLGETGAVVDLSTWNAWH
jgi:hypothetical protein